MCSDLQSCAVHLELCLGVPKPPGISISILLLVRWVGGAGGWKGGGILLKMANTNIKKTSYFGVLVVEVYVY